MASRFLSAVLAGGVLTGLNAGAEEASFRFEERVLDPHAGDIVYAVTHADVDGDGRQDVVAVTEDQVLWYKNPDWTKGVILDGRTTRDNVCIDPHDVDGDGRIDFALGAGWPQSGGTIQWIGRGPEGEDWKVHLVGAIPSTHRMRWADVLGTGKPQLVVSPLNKSGDDAGARLTAFEIPADPKTGRWKETVLDATLNRVHNHWHTNRDRDGVPETFVASQEGVHLIRKSGESFTKDRISGGAAGAKPTEQGAGEIKTGAIAGGTPLIATVEPMHGNMTVAYVAGESKWRRVVLDDTLGRGHALWLADLDGDGGDEVVVGHSDPATGPVKGPGVYVYQADDADGEKWTKHVVDDGGMATEDLFSLDLTGDGRPDLVAGGRNTHNVKLYVNRGDTAKGTGAERRSEGDAD